jgi:hypothetical protein
MNKKTRKSKKSRKFRKSKKQRKQRGGFAYSPQPGTLVGFTRKAGVDSMPTVGEYRDMLPDDERA